jgi:osmotically-inducible protein OsmY
MTTAVLTATDLRLRDAVMRQLEWDSQVEASGVGITAKDSVVTLTGYINTYAGKLAAERAAKRVRGVRAVANDIQVRLRIERTDSEIATDAARALDLRATLPDTVQAVVHGGHLTLTGSVPTLFQRAVAQNAVRHIRGLKGVVNRITVAPPATANHLKRDIVRAIHREADLHARGINVTVNGDIVVLEGVVDSWQTRESAERAAMHGPGITHVENLLSVNPGATLDEDWDDTD